MISLRKVSKSFDGGRSFAVRDVSVDIAERLFVAIIGDSGSGKTTLLKMINRLVDADGGSVVVAGKPVDSDAPYGLRRRIGYVFQGVGLFPHMTVAENIAVTPRLIGWDAQRRAARVDELIDLVRLSRDQRERYPHQLSGGERQRVGVARALAASPRIVLMDEPFGALDPINRDAISRDYRRLHDDLGLTTVMITHDMLEAVLLADRVAVMQAGRVIAQGSPHTLMSGAHGDYVDELMATPRRQAGQLAELIDRGARA